MSRRLPCRLAVVSHAVPPMLVGTALRICRLLADTDPVDYRLFTCRDVPPVDSKTELPSLPGQPVRVNRGWRQLRGRGGPRLRRLIEDVNIRLRHVQRERHLVRLLTDFGAEAVLAFTGDDVDVPAASRAARRLGLPFVAAIDDDYRRQWRRPVQAAFARRHEPRALRDAAGVLAISDAVAEVYRQRYPALGPRVEVLYNPTAQPVETGMIPPGRRGVLATLRLAFTGSVNHGNIDAFNLLADAVALVRDDVAVEIAVYTAQKPEELESRGLSTAFTVKQPVSPRAIQSVLAAADVVFLPMGMRGELLEVMKTSCPFKFSDYSVCGRPILAACPPDAFLAAYLQRHACGAVVAELDAGGMAETLRRLARDEAWRDELAGNAMHAAARDFDCDRVRDRFGMLLADMTGREQR